MVTFIDGFVLALALFLAFEAANADVQILLFLAYEAADDDQALGNIERESGLPLKSPGPAE
jgi:hypothetical protein